MFEEIKKLIETNYELGKVTSVAELFGGAINRSFKAVIQKDGVSEYYFVRQYVSKMAETEILYEHGLMTHIRKNGFILNSLPITALNGKTYIRETFVDGSHFYSVHEWLEGDEPYSWLNSNVTAKACKSATEVLAEFHCKAYEYVPQKGCKCNEPIMEEQLKYYYDDFNLWVYELAKDHTKQHFSEYMLSQLDYIKACIEKTFIIYEYSEALPVTHIHTDAHLGNYKFIDDEVSGIFDFDWAKEDVRLYDVAMSASVFCSSWYYHNVGEVDIDLLKLYFKTYNDYMRKSNCPLGPLNDTEMRNMPLMMIATNLYIMHACCGQLYRNRSLNGFEWLYYMIHQVGSFKWIEDHHDEIVEVCKNS